MKSLANFIILEWFWFWFWFWLFNGKIQEGTGFPWRSFALKGHAILFAASRTSAELERFRIGYKHLCVLIFFGPRPRSDQDPVAE
jgi:hypothetical protein